MSLWACLEDWTRFHSLMSTEGGTIPWVDPGQWKWKQGAEQQVFICYTLIFTKDLIRLVSQAPPLWRPPWWTVPWSKSWKKFLSPVSCFFWAFYHSNRKRNKDICHITVVTIAFIFCFWDRALASLEFATQTRLAGFRVIDSLLPLLP